VIGNILREGSAVGSVDRCASNVLKFHIFEKLVV
jgi:hypothetical protein